MTWITWIDMNYGNWHKFIRLNVMNLFVWMTWIDMNFMIRHEYHDLICMSWFDMIWHECRDLTWMSGFDMNGVIWHECRDLTWMSWFDMNVVIWHEGHDLTSMIPFPGPFNESRRHNAVGASDGTSPRTRTRRVDSFCDFCGRAKRLTLSLSRTPKKTLKTCESFGTGWTRPITPKITKNK
jgi:hypothetical protein